MGLDAITYLLSGHAMHNKAHLVYKNVVSVQGRVQRVTPLYPTPLTQSKKVGMTQLYKEFALEAVGFGDKGDGQYVSIYDNHPSKRVAFKLGELGDTMKETTALRVAFPPQPNKFDPSKHELTVEVEGGPRDFLRRLEGKVVDAAVTNKKTWFKKDISDEKVRTLFSSRVKTSKSARFPADTMKVRVDPDETDVSLVHVESNGAIKDRGEASLRKRSLDAIARDSLVIISARLRGGVYFQENAFGISFEATSILVLGLGRGVKRGISPLRRDRGGVSEVDKRLNAVTSLMGEPVCGDAGVCKQCGGYEDYLGDDVYACMVCM